MRLRPPQADALREVRDALLRLPKPLSRCTPEERREYLAVKDEWRHPFHPTFTLALATGLGKTRLAGAIMALMWLANEARVFIVLAPRRAVLRRFEAALDANFREYIFIDPNLVPEPSIVRNDEIDSPRSFEFEGDLLSNGPKIFLLSPQLIATSERFSRRPEFSELSPADALRTRGDVVVIADEAHHIGKASSKDTTAWASAIRQLLPAMQIGMTATPRREAGEHVLYEYPLDRALRDGLYTKSVNVCVRHFSETSLTADDIDKSAIHYSLDRLERKESAVRAAPTSFPPTKPVCVLFAKDIEHAEQVVEWVVGTGRVRCDEVLLTHSAMSKSEEEIEKLLSIEKTANPIRVVVNVMELTEGWDVTNVYVVTPLRAMATFQGALQAMGRGLRLPAGHRIGDPVLDQLDVVCFGRKALAKIVEEATAWSGVRADQAAGIRVSEFDKADPVIAHLKIPIQRVESFAFSSYSYVEDELTLKLDAGALQRVKEAIVTDIELSSAKTRLGIGKPKLARDRFVTAAALRTIKTLNKYLSDAEHFQTVSALVSEWLETVRPGQDQVDFDPAEVGEEVASALEAGARLKPARYETSTGIETVTFTKYTGRQEVMIAADAPVPTIRLQDLPTYEGRDFVPAQLYGGWSKAVHPACSFSSEPEALVARLLESAASVVWWARNDPFRFRLDTPAGEFRPDFVVMIRDARGDRFLVLEAKGDHLWKDPTDDARLKAAAARHWAAAQRAAGHAIYVGVALESDIRRSGSWAELEMRLEVDA